MNQQAKWGFICIGVAAAIALNSMSSSTPSSSTPSSSTPSTRSTDRVTIGETGYLREADGGGVWVFKSQDSLSKARSLARAGADASLVLQELACRVPTNTKVLVITGQISSAFLSGMGGTSDVMIVTGPQAGCKGTLAKDKVFPGPA